MLIRPRDLGSKWHVILVRQRALGPAKAWPHQRPLTPHIGMLGRMWTRKMDLPDEVAAQTLPAASNETMGWMYGILGGVGWLPFTGVILCALSGKVEMAAAYAATGYAMTWLAAVDLPGRAFRKLHERPIQPEELESLVTPVAIPGMSPALNKAAERLLRHVGAEGLIGGPPPMDPMDRSFLALAQDMARLEHVPPATEEELLEALRALGEAASRLPVETTLSVTEAADLRGDADALLARAHREADEIVAASLRRQAEALLRSAEAQERTQVLNRRARILRQELQAQMDSLRASLPTLAASQAAVTFPHAGSQSGPFNHLADTVRGIADEAVSVAAARQELDTFTASASRAAEAARRTYSPPEEEAATLRVGRRPGG